MTQSQETETVGSPVKVIRRAISKSWRSLKSIYYANSMSWRFMKSGALVFLGFFLWSSSNLLLSYQPDWTLLNYPLAYGFILIFYGPFHHLVVIPAFIRLRRKGVTAVRLSKHVHLPNISLAVFFILVIVLGTFPLPFMTFNFQSAIGDTVDVNPNLLCTKSTSGTETIIHCHLTRSEGIDHITVETSGKQIYVDREPPFDFTIKGSELEEVVGQKQFQVVLRDENGDEIRRYTRTVSMIS
ncbi:MAG: hypothetical protein SV377_00355 [Halobacteria archaeon]|nr:hypothetical protein [Halobacteria archaeon]